MPGPPMPVRSNSRSTALPPLTSSTEYGSEPTRSLLCAHGSTALADPRRDVNLMDTLADPDVDRSLGDRPSQYADEIQRVLETTYDLIESSGNVDPSLREILAATNLSTQAFYRYFRSKDQRFLLLLCDCSRTSV